MATIIEFQRSMKRLGAIILTMGVLITIATGFDMLTREPPVDMANIELLHDNPNVLTWYQLTGIAIMVVGGGLYFYGSRATKKEKLK